MATAIITKIVYETSSVCVDRTIGVDDKGAVIGLRVVSREVDLVEVGSGQGGFLYKNAGVSVTPGHKFAAKIQKLKNGKPWGATQPERFYDSEEKRREAIERRVREAKA